MVLRFRQTSGIHTFSSSFSISDQVERFEPPLSFFFVSPFRSCYPRMPFYRPSLSIQLFFSLVSLSLCGSVFPFISLDALKGYIYIYRQSKVSKRKEFLRRAQGKRDDFLSKSDNRNSIIVNDDRETSAPRFDTMENFEQSVVWIMIWWYRFQWAHQTLWWFFSALPTKGNVYICKWREIP